MTGNLTIYDHACHALAEAARVDEVIGVRDQAERMKLYAMQAKDRTMLANATEIHMRATRKLGEMLIAAKEAGQLGEGRPKKRKPSEENGSAEEPFIRVTLEDAGISKKLSMNAQQSASISEMAFEAMVENTRQRIAAGAAAVINPLKEVTTAQKKERRALRERDLADKQLALPDKRYGVILADPEWKFKTRSEAGMDRSADNQYPCSELEAIKSRDVHGIEADDCVLFLWATVPMLPHAIEVMRAWGFEYKSHVIWHKNRPGTGYWFRNEHELLLVGTRGDVPAPAMGSQWGSVVDADVTEHSAKPEIFYHLIEEYYPSLPKIELNARARREGWDAWGFEAPELPPHDSETGGIVEASEIPAEEVHDGSAQETAAEDTAENAALDNSAGVKQGTPEGLQAGEVPPFPASPANQITGTKPELMIADDIGDIPSFLRRGHPDCNLGEST